VANLAAWREACANANGVETLKEAAMLRRGLLVVLSVIAGSTFAVGTAHAKPPGYYSGSDSFSFSDCGFQIDAVITFSGTFRIKGGRHGDPTPYLLDNYQYHNVFTNPATGAFFTISGNGMTKDLQIVNVSGTVYSIEFIEVGQPVVVRDMNGKVVIRDRGHILFRVSIDTLGDDNIDNDIEIPGSFEIVAINGPHPVLEGVDLCDVASDLIG
jgi:hypothetical protein